MLKKINCVIMADGSSKIGHGHLKRCLALSELLQDYCNIYFFAKNIPIYIETDLKKIGVKVILLPPISQREECLYIHNRIKKFKLIIIDGYKFNYKYENFFYEKNKKVITIDDMINRKFYSNIIINHAPLISKNKYKTLTNTKLLLGLDYKIIQKCFYPKKIIDKSKIKNNIFVCLGSGSANSLFKVKLIKFLLNLESVNKIFFVTSNKDAFNKKFENNKKFKQLEIYEDISSVNIFKLMQKSRFGICTASTVALESYTANLPMLIGYSANNQLNIYKGLTRSKISIGIGNLKNLKIEKLNLKIKRIEDNSYIKKYLYSQKIISYSSSTKKLLSEILL